MNLTNKQNDLVPARIIFKSTYTPYSPTCMKIEDLFLDNPSIYFTPMTVSKTLKISPNTTKANMRLLLSNSYLTKDDGNNYSITKENMEFWVTDFRNHVLVLKKLQSEKEIENLPVNEVEDDE